MHSAVRITVIVVVGALAVPLVRPDLFASHRLDGESATAFTESLEDVMRDLSAEEQENLQHAIVVLTSARVEAAENGRHAPPSVRGMVNGMTAEDVIALASTVEESGMR